MSAKPSAKQAGPPCGGQTFLREARERGARHINLEMHTPPGDGISLALRPDGEVVIDAHNVFKHNQSDMGMYLSLGDALRPSTFGREVEARGAGWFKPFLHKLVHGGDFTWQQVEDAAGHPLRVNYFHC